MRYLRRIVDVTWRMLVPADGTVMLLHVPSGRVLTHGPEAVRFPSVSAAGAFRSRYLDEAAAWETVRLDQLGCAA
jgi:hypothetical protein